MKKVLFVATVVKTHIMEFHIPYLKMFKEMGWETAVAARNDYENPADCLITYCDIYYNIPFERNPLKPGNLKAYKELKHIIDEGEYDIIHCHTPVGAMLTRLAAKQARKQGTKVFYTAHGFHFYKGAPAINWLLYYPVEKWLSRYTDVLITINKEDYERAKTFKAGKVCYVPGVGIDLKKFNAGYVNKEQKALDRDEIQTVIEKLQGEKPQRSKSREKLTAAEHLLELWKKRLFLKKVDYYWLDDTVDRIAFSKDNTLTVHWRCGLKTTVPLPVRHHRENPVYAAEVYRKRKVEGTLKPRRRIQKRLEDLNPIPIIPVKEGQKK